MLPEIYLKRMGLLFEFFLKNGPIPASFLFIFRSFLNTISIQIEKSIDGVLGIRTRGHRMVGADKTTELWRPPKLLFELGSVLLPPWPLNVGSSIEY